MEGTAVDVRAGYIPSGSPDSASGSVNDLVAALGTLEMEFDSLTSRIAPVLRPSSPSEDRLSEVAMTDLHIQIARVRAFTDHVVSIRDRVVA